MGAGLPPSCCSSRGTSAVTSPAMAEVIACDASPQALGFPPDDYSTYPVQLIPVLAMCNICEGPADGNRGLQNTCGVKGTPKSKPHGHVPIIEPQATTYPVSRTLGHGMHRMCLSPGFFL